MHSLRHVPEIQEAHEKRHQILNVGCGRHQPIDGWWHNTDNVPGIGIGNYRVWDLSQSPWPWPSAFFRAVYASHVLEHLPQPKHGFKDPLFTVMKEAYRVLDDEGIFVIRVPDARYHGQAFSHPQHYRHFTTLTFRYLANTLQENWYHNTHWHVKRVQRVPWAYRFGDFARVRGFGLVTHACERVKPLGGVLARDGEIVAVLQKPGKRGF